MCWAKYKIHFHECRAKCWSIFSEIMMPDIDSGSSASRKNHFQDIFSVMMPYGFSISSFYRTAFSFVIKIFLCVTSSWLNWLLNKAYRKVHRNDAFSEMSWTFCPSKMVVCYPFPWMHEHCYSKIIFNIYAFLCHFFISFHRVMKSSAELSNSNRTNTQKWNSCLSELGRGIISHQNLCLRDCQTKFIRK